ncbi:hypothetical protein [Polyangium jinanense]|uniref:Uncharacterized protein n=1 Tax=Polyangium jinanense TaxID=2829994 RepID=A0A9X4AXM4_9BACT|nr:hypothetical protein [Polyangium jinanense]MDC3958955.1 hypothetical protein [Polyangium jinanense]MDC3986420.1 hypothetical protein [Polyangium jinanense]
MTLVEGLDTSVPTEGKMRPALNVPFEDEHYHLKVARVTDASQVTDHDIPSWVRHEYSRRPAFNADSTRALMLSSNGWMRLYEVKPDGTQAFLKTLALGEPQEPNWHPTDPNKLYFFESYGQGLTISTYDITSDEKSTSRDLGTRVKALFPGATGMWTKQEGRPSDDGKIWCLEAGHTTAGNFVPDGLFAYDFDADKILGHMPVTEAPDHISTSPKGNYCVPSWGVPMGTRAYKTDFSSYTQLHDRSEHSDLAITKDGDEVLVYTAYDGANAGNVVMVELAGGTATPLVPLYGENNGSAAMHISGTSKNKPGYAVIGFYACSEEYGAKACDPSAQWFYNKVIAVELQANPKVYNLAHTHYGNAGYFTSAQAIANPDLTKVLFASTWESTMENDVASYLIQVPACALP